MSKPFKAGCARPESTVKATPDTKSLELNVTKEVRNMIKVGLTPPVGRNVGESKRQLQAFQLVRASKGTKATPSGWQPGKKVLHPGPDLVGNVWKEWTAKDSK